MKTIKTAVFGASGYAGGELLRILAGHPFAEVVWAAAERNAGRKVSDIFPGLRGTVDLKLRPSDPGLMPAAVDVVFTALPHGSSSRIMKRLLRKGVRVIDLGADFRIGRANYKKWYGGHPCPELIKEARYGIPELYAEDIKKARIVANPGCYPTGAILALAPFTGLASENRVVIDSKSGVSGAGRNPDPGLVFGEVNEAVKPYKPGSHRHIPEIEENLTVLSGFRTTADFTPHLVPMNRGILTTAYVRLKKKATSAALTKIAGDFYKDARFVRIRKSGECPSTADVRGSNYCDIAVASSPDGKTATVMSAIDNLMKGASGQAVQNMNLMAGLEEDEGLRGTAVFP